MNRLSLRSSSVRARRAGGAAAATLLLSTCAWSSASASSVEATAAKDNGVSQKTPAQIVAAAQSALHSAKSFVLSGKITQGKQAVGLRVVNESSSKFELEISDSGKTASIIVLGGAGYVKADKAYWTAEKVPKAASYANKWIELPGNYGKQLSSGLGEFSPGTLSRCLGEDVGTLSRAGTTKVTGRPAVVLHDAGDVPGGAPGNLAIATNGPAYPLRVTTTGPTRAGGKIDACNDGKASNIEGSLTLTDFDQVPAIKAPPTTVKLGTDPSTSA
jgi:hypothetical protein